MNAQNQSIRLHETSNAYVGIIEIIDVFAYQILNNKIVCMQPSIIRNYQQKFSSKYIL